MMNYDELVKAKDKLARQDNIKNLDYDTRKLIDQIITKAMEYRKKLDDLKNRIDEVSD